MNANPSASRTEVSPYLSLPDAADFDYEAALNEVEPEVLRQFGKDLSLLVCWSADALLTAARDARYEDVVKGVLPLRRLMRCLGIRPLEYRMHNLSQAASRRDHAEVMSQIGDVLVGLSSLTPMIAKQTARLREAQDRASRLTQ